MDPETLNQTTQTETEKTAKAAEEKLLPQSQVNDIVARETAKARRAIQERDAELEKLRAERDAAAAEKAAAEEAKLSATQRAELERKREREALEKRIAELDGLAKSERSRRHDALIRHAAASRVSTVAAKLFNGEIATDVETLVASALRVEEIDGREVVTIRLGAEGDTEPLDTGWAKFEAARLSKFFKAEGGAGARHGGGTNGGSRAAWEGLSPADKIAAGLQARRPG